MKDMDLVNFVIVQGGVFAWMPALGQLSLPKSKRSDAKFYGF